MCRQKSEVDMTCLHAKQKDGTGGTVFFMLVALRISIEPFANIVANYTCYDRN
nr:MAG TPA: hypothetical protein [Caudoviricetes sp.]